MDDDREIDEAAGSGGAAPWLATFADMMTLLLCFFVLLLSMATIDIAKFQTALGAIQEVLGVQHDQPGSFAARASSPLQPFEHEARGPRADQVLLTELRDAIVAEGLQDEAGVAIDGRGVIVRIDGQVLYAQGDAALKPEAASMLTRLAGVIRGTAHRVMIEGHTDDVPIQTARYRSNWELSTARAIAAMRYLVEQEVDAERIGVAGYADQRPLASNDTPAHRATNRRVEFVFIRALEHEPEDEPPQSIPAAGGVASEAALAASDAELDRPRASAGL